MTENNNNYYNIPLPHDLEQISWTNMGKLGGDIWDLESENTLSYINVVCDYYQNNDYILFLNCADYQRPRLEAEKIPNHQKYIIKCYRDYIENEYKEKIE